QLEVVRHVNGPLAVYAGAGSGKTSAAVKRVVALVNSGVAADRTFMVTFSRPGANEMASRIRQLGIGGVEVKTWHAFCGRVLREEGTEQGRWTVDEKDRAKTFVKQAGGYQHEKWTGMDLTKVCRFIGVCKANLWDAESPEASALARRTFGPAGSRAVRVFSISQGLIEGAQLLTFDDMLVYVARLFQENDDVRASWAAKFDFVITDEAQDNSRVQVVLQKALAQDHRNLMVVGDPSQAIYKFRGSDPKYLMDFVSEWDARVVTMAKNYRSGRAIVAVANELIRPADARLAEDMTAMRDIDGKVEVVEADNLDDEASEFVSFCKARLASGQSLADIYVLFRLNAQSRALEEALLREKLPYILIGGVNFYERKAVKDLLAYLRLAAGKDVEGDAFKRCINAPFRFLGAKFIERAMEIRGSASTNAETASWADVVEVAAEQTGVQRQKESVRRWVEIIEHVTEMIAEGVRVSEDKREPASASKVLQYVIESTGYIGWLEKEEGEESIESSHAADIREMVRVAASFKSVGELLDFVSIQVTESSRNKKRARSDRCVTMMSIHKSKGLQAPVVWLVGCNSGILPHAKGDLEEERRIMYVAATRAEDHLVVSYVREMALRTGVRSVDRSEFLDVFPGGEDEVSEAPTEDPVLASEDVSFFVAIRRLDAEVEVEEARELGRNPGSVRPGVAAIFGDAKCLCGESLLGHGETCASA